jgi:hypothetical protein
MKPNQKFKTKSLGSSFSSEKTKPRSPDMTGKLRILKPLRQIINTHREEDGDVFEGNIAGWFNDDRGQKYITVELSPLYRHGSQRSKKDMTVEEFFAQIAEEQE